MAGAPNKSTAAQPVTKTGGSTTGAAAPADAAPRAAEPQPAAPPATIRRRFNWKAAAIAAAVFVVGAGTVHGVRWLQVDRLSDDLKERALAAEEKGEAEEAFRLFAEYRLLQPDDLDAVVRSADLLEEFGGPGVLSEVIRLRETALRLDPELDDVRRKLAGDLLVLAARQPRASNYNAALTHITRLQKDDPEARDAELLVDRAAAEAGLGRDAEAAKWLMLAIDRAPEDPAPYMTLARLLTAEGFDGAPTARVWSEGPAPESDAVRSLTDRPASADRSEQIAEEVADLLAERAAPRRTALLRRGQLLREWDRPTDAAAAAGAAFAAEGGAADSDVLRFGAETELQLAGDAVGARDPQGRDAHIGQAREYVVAGMQLSPPDPRLARVAAQLELIDGYTTEAGAAAKAVLEDALAQLTAAADDGLNETLEPEAGGMSAVEHLVTEWQVRTLLSEIALAEGTAGNLAPAEAAAEVDRQLTALSRLGTFTETAQTLRGRSALLTGDAATAVRELERAAAGLADGSIRVNDRGGRLPIGPEALSTVNLLLADAYSRMQNPERAISILQEALRSNPTFAAARQPLALLLAQKGDVDGALRVLEPVGGTPSLAPLVAELAVRRELAKPLGERDFRAAEAAVANAQRAAEQDEDDPSAAVAPTLLRAQLFAAQENYEAAGGALIDLLDSGGDLGAPVRSSLWRTRLALELTRTDVEAEVRREAAERLLADARADVGETPEVRLAEVSVAALRGPEIFREALRDAVAEAADLPPEERSAVRAGLIRLAAENERVDVVRQLWTDLAADNPNNFAARNVLAEFTLADLQAARENPDVDVAPAAAAFEAALAEVRRLEGPSGPNGDRLVAARILADPDAPEAELTAAADRLDNALRQRPLWPAAARLQGLAALRLGADQAAYDWFSKARTWGDRSQETLVQLVGLLRARGRSAEAAQLLKTADQQTPGVVSGPVARLAWQVSAELNETDRLVELSTQLVREGGSAGDQMLRALSLGARFLELPMNRRDTPEGRQSREAAVEAFESVTDAAPGDVGGWLARLRFLREAYELDDDGPQRVAKIADAAEAALPKLSEPDSTVRSARLREAAGDLQRAAELYRTAATGGGDAPDVEGHPRAVAEAAAFFLRNGARDEAQPLLDALTKTGAELPKAVADWLRPRRDLAAAVTGRWEDVRPALEQFPPPSAATPEDLRSQLSLLGMRNTLPFRRLRIERLSALANAGPTTGRELLELAALLEATGRWADARPLFQTVLDAKPEAPEALVPLIRGAILHESVPAGGAGTLPDAVADRVRPLMERLQQVAPDSDLTKLTAAEFAAATGDRDAAAAGLRSLAGLDADGAGGGDQGSLQRLNLLATTAERLELNDVADELYDALQKRATRPEDKTVPAGHLARTGRFTEALELVERYAGEAVPEATAARAVQIVVLGQVPEEVFERAAGLVEAALRLEPGSARIRKVRADLNAARGRIAAAEREYRELLQETPDDTDLLNNLAWLLASAPLRETGNAKPDPAESNRLLDRAEAIDGPTANLRDTRAMIPVLTHAAGGSPGSAALGAAVNSLEELAAIDASPTILFHLAAARWAVGDPNAARALTTALSAGLSPDVLHPSEHPLLRRVLRDLRGSEDLMRTEQ
ncbi:tetratricopeptide repeat protein [Alienimonas californiensis]|uniref:Tetratricopeptide repeat protein n=1 Tax=Alienimonas californiensis TaxID=2527989 RepID=A0A517P4B3_9PLAN|nr:tetratricopeptide repeat protein [Alienimonas californiensis]QDT14201.1 hypothetical protein CA12_02690 [Alienimonas californiensis]